MPISDKNHDVAVNAVRRLRINKLRNGHPFLIYSRDLPSRYAYLEYPEGHIVLVTVKSGEHDFTSIRELTHEENIAIRNEFNLERVTQ